MSFQKANNKIDLCISYAMVSLDIDNSFQIKPKNIVINEFKKKLKTNENHKK